MNDERTFKQNSAEIDTRNDLLDSAGFLACGCHGSARDHTCGVIRYVETMHPKPAFQPATWGGLVLWLHMCGHVSKWPSANEVPGNCRDCIQPIDEDNWKLLYERIT